MKRIYIIFFCIAMVLDTIFPQSFGKNKVQYREFDWSVIQSKHFDIYYYDNNLKLAEFTAEVAESSYLSLKKIYRYEIQDRIPILVYNGHNDFEQTNVTWGMIEESVGGFTEIFKDRVVLPFQGSYKEFRHVLHHELTHAVMFQMFYGGGVGSRLSGMARFQVPLWLAEGLAEYASLGWDTDSDMFMRDASLNGNVPPIHYMYGYMVYKGGQSVLNYIGDKYGHLKIGEILGKVRLHKNIDRGIKQSIGIDLEELSKRWHKYLRKTYWPDIQNRDEPEDVSKRLTDHRKRNHFLNSSPAISPLGDKLVYLSDRDDYMDIHLMSIFDKKDLGRLVKGQRSDLFEELHWLRPGMDWSPDGKKIVLASKAGEQDAFHIMDVEKRKRIASYQFELDAIYSPTWSPDGATIAFMGIKNGQSDIYTYHMEKDSLSKLTDDVFSDMDPSWSHNGEFLVFISDRGSFLKAPDSHFQIRTHNYKKEDIYLISLQNKIIRRVTDNVTSEQSPKFSPDDKSLLYASDESGINNIYILDLETNDHYAITNLISGASQISLSNDGNRLVFSSFFEGGFDLYLLNNPFQIEQSDFIPAKTVFIKQSENDEKKSIEALFKSDEIVTPVKNDYGDYVFGHEFRKGHVSPTSGQKNSFLDSAAYKEENGDYKTKPYKLRFTPDVVTGSAGYSQFWGLQGSTMLVFSDILGNHQINLYSDLFYNFKNSNFMGSYFYLPKQIDYGLSVFHYSYLYYTYFIQDGYLNYGYLRNRMYGASLFASRPINRYKRFDIGITGTTIDRDLVATYYDPYYYYYDEEEVGNISKSHLLLLNLGYTTDTVLWGSTGPMNGGRSNLSFTYSPRISQSNGVDFWTMTADWRRYFRIRRGYGFGMRFTGGVSEGENPQRFLLGGMTNWINYKFRDIPDDVITDDLFFFSSFEGPLRGTPFYEMIGSRFMLANFEFRFPAIKYLILGILPFGLQNIRGITFFDIGTAFSDYETWDPYVSSSVSTLPRLKEMRAGYGFGLRANLGFMVLRYDLGWATDLVTTADKPIHYFSLGADF